MNFKQFVNYIIDGKEIQVMAYKKFEDLNSHKNLKSFSLKDLEGYFKGRCFRLKPKEVIELENSIKELHKRIKTINTIS